MNETNAYRRNLMIAAIVLAAVFLLGYGLITRSLGRQTNPSGETAGDVSVSELNYCSEEEVRPCVVSFGLDANDNMLVNLLLPEPSFPNFYLTIEYGEKRNSFNCRKVAATKSNAYCIGEKYPPGEVLHLLLVSIEGDMLLAEGDLPIIGLAFPTLAIITQTSAPTGTPEGTEILEPTSTKPVIATKTRIIFPTPTRTPPSYP